MTSLQDQQEQNKKLANDVQSALSGLTINAQRSFGDAKRDPSGRLAEQHLSAVSKALGSINWSEYGKGKFDIQYIQKHLDMELTLDDLVGNTEPPRYDRLLDVLDAMNELLATEGITGQYRDAIVRAQQQMDLAKEKFQNSQVNVDEMDHAPFYRTVGVLKQLVLTSVESIVERMDQQSASLIQKYNDLVREHLAAFEREAVLVKSSTPARLRPSRPEDDEDPWQVPREKQKLSFESAALQRYVENEERARVANEYEEEWYQGRRNHIATVLPRAKRVIFEIDEHFYPQTREILQQLVSNSEDRLRSVEESTMHTEETARNTIGGLHQHYAEMVEAGDHFQEKKREKRGRSERDVERLTRFIEEEKKADILARETFLHRRDNAVDWLGQNEAIIKDLLQKVIDLQEEIVKVAGSRKAVSDELIELVDAEEKRKSEFAVKMETCVKYKEMLDNSMQNFLLPEGYSNALAQFAHECEQMAKDRFEGFASILQDLKVKAVQENHKMLSTACLCSLPIQLRKEKKAADLKAKADVARDQRDFCISTKDPYSEHHENTEQQILEMLREMESQIPPLGEDTANARLRYNARYGGAKGYELMAECNVQKPWEDIDDLILDNITRNAEYIIKGPRAPIVNLDFDSNDRLVVPPEFYDPILVERAARAQNIQRQFV